VRQELDAHRLSHIRCHVDLHVCPVGSITQMVDRLQDGAGAIGDVGILPVERDAVIRAVLVVEAQRARTSRDSELLIE